MDEFTEKLRQALSKFRHCNKQGEGSTALSPFSRISQPMEGKTPTIYLEGLSHQSQRMPHTIQPNRDISEHSNWKSTKLFMNIYLNNKSKSAAFIFLHFLAICIFTFSACDLVFPQQPALISSRSHNVAISLHYICSQRRCARFFCNNCTNIK